MAQYNIEMNSFDGSNYNQLYPKTSINNIPDWNSVIYSKDSIDDYKQSVQETIDSINTTLNTGVYFKTGGTKTPLFEKKTVNLSSYSVGDTVPILERTTLQSSNFKLVDYKVYSTDGSTKSLIRSSYISKGNYGSSRSGSFFETDLYTDDLTSFVEDYLYDPIKSLLRTTNVTCCTSDSNSSSYKVTQAVSYYTLGRGNTNFSESYYTTTLASYITDDDMEAYTHYLTMDKPETGTAFYSLRYRNSTSAPTLYTGATTGRYIPIIVLDANGSFEYYTDGTKVYDHQEYRSDTNTFVDNLGNILSANIERGTYVGTGQSGPTYPNRLVFTFEPKWVCVSGSNYSVGEYDDWSGFVIINGVTKAGVAEVTWSDNTISWYVDTGYSGDDTRQLNESGQTYYYIACY